MNVSKIYLVLLTVSVAILLYSCDSVTDSAQQDEIQSQNLTIEREAKKEKIDVCHYDADLNAYELINISGNAEQAHIKHGDALPGEPVPTMENYEFDETCTPQPIIVDEITACFSTVLADYREYHAGQNGETLLVNEDGTDGWRDDFTQPQNGYTIVTLFDHIIDAYGNGGLTLSAYENNSGAFCSIEITDFYSRFPGSTAPTDNLSNDIRYLEYLITENPCNPLPNSFACQN